MIDIKNLGITQLRDGRTLLTGLSFTLHAGDRVALIGEEGNGKSTLLKLLCDESLITSYCEWQGDIVRNGARIGYLPQDPAAGREDVPVSRFLAAADGQAMRAAFGRMRLDSSLFTDTRPLGTLSGGERVKVCLLALLASAPDVLLLDEPTNDLDLASLRWLEDFLLAAQVPVLYISHDETLLARTANAIIHIEQRNRRNLPVCTAVRMGYEEYVEKRLTGLARQRQIGRKQREDYEDKAARWQQIYNKVEHQQSTITRQDPGGGRLLKKKIHALKSQKRRIDREAESFEDLPSVEEAIEFRFDERAALPAGRRVLDFALPTLQIGTRVLAHDLRLSLTGPERIGIIGPNGAGKSTLLRLLHDAVRQRGLAVGYMPQNYAETLRQDMTPAQVLAPEGDRASLLRARTFLGSMNYTPEEMLRPVSSLSGGQRAKLLLLSLVFMSPQVLILDEPTRNLSPLSGPVIRQALRDYRGAILCVTHDRLLLSEVCTQVYELTEDGLARI